jgi:hypothetical protein
MVLTSVRLLPIDTCQRILSNRTLEAPLFIPLHGLMTTRYRGDDAFLCSREGGDFTHHQTTSYRVISWSFPITLPLIPRTDLPSGFEGTDRTTNFLSKPISLPRIHKARSSLIGLVTFSWCSTSSARLPTPTGLLVSSSKMGNHQTSWDICLGESCAVSTLRKAMAAERPKPVSSVVLTKPSGAVWPGLRSCRNVGYRAGMAKHSICWCGDHQCGSKKTCMRCSPSEISAMKSAAVR